MPKLDMISHSIELPDGVSATISGYDVTVAKDGKSVSLKFGRSSTDIKIPTGLFSASYESVNVKNNDPDFLGSI